jgi:hypothetical protein
VTVDVIHMMMMNMMMMKMMIDDNKNDDISYISPNKTDNTAFFVFRNQKLVKSCDLFE